MEDINFWEWLKKRSEINKEQQKELDLFVKRMLDHESMRRPKGK